MACLCDRTVSSEIQKPVRSARRPQATGCRGAMSPPCCTPNSSVSLPAGAGTCGGRKEAGRTGPCPGLALGGEPGVYAPKCRSISRGTPSKWEWRNCETASGMSSLRPAGSCASGPSDDDRNTTPHGPRTPTGNTPPAKPTVEDEDRSTDTSTTRRSKWTSRRPRNRTKSQRPSTSGGTARAARTGPRPAAATLGIDTIARHRGVAVPTATSGWTPVSTQAAMIAMLQPPSYPTRTRGTSTTPAGGVVPGRLHALVVVDRLDANDGELRRVVELRVRDGREPGTKLVAEDASVQPRVHFPRQGVIHLLPSHPERFGEDLGVHFLGCVPLLLGPALCLVGGCGFAWGGGRITEDKAPRQFNNSPLAAKRVRVLLATSSPSRVSKQHSPIAPQALVSALQKDPAGPMGHNPTLTHSGDQ